MTEQGIFELSPRNILAGLFILYICAPFLVLITFGEHDFTVQIIAPLWWIYFSQYVGNQVGPYPQSDQFSVQFNPILVMGSIPLSLLQLIFIFMLYRYYLGETTRSKTIFTGILGALQPSLYMLLILLPVYIYLPPGTEFPPILPISIPIVPIIGYFLMRLRKPNIDDTWLEKPKPTW